MRYTISNTYHQPRAIDALLSNPDNVAVTRVERSGSCDVIYRREGLWFGVFKFDKSGPSIAEQIRLHNTLFEVREGYCNAASIISSYSDEGQVITMFANSDLGELDKYAREKPPVAINAEDLRVVIEKHPDYHLKIHHNEGFVDLKPTDIYVNEKDKVITISATSEFMLLYP